MENKVVRQSVTKRVMNFLKMALLDINVEICIASEKCGKLIQTKVWSECLCQPLIALWLMLCF